MYTRNSGMILKRLVWCELDHNVQYDWIQLSFNSSPSFGQCNGVSSGEGVITTYI